MSAAITPTTEERPISARTRFGAALGTWTLLFLAGPGILDRDGSLALAFVALVPWALFCSRPGRHAFRVEWLAAGIGLSASCIWSTYVLWITLLAVALVPAVYMAFAGVVLRRLARCLPLALAVPVAWIGLETLRTIVEPPFGFGWMRLGHHAHAHLWFAGSARVFGTGGIGWVIAAFAGGMADVLQARSEKRALDRPVLVGAFALGPLALALVFALVTHAPATEPGPRLMCVQPAFAQERKMNSPLPMELFDESIALTRRGLEEAQKAGEPMPDLVAWGETMFPFSLVTSDTLAAWDRGARPVPWARDQFDRRQVEQMLTIEREAVGGVFFGHGRSGPAVLPGGASFLTGVELYAPHDGDLRRENAIVAWGATGAQSGIAGKVHLVPGGEQLCGLERLGFVRDLSFELAGYVPDLVAFERTQVLDLNCRDGRTFQFGATVCFDNAYDGPYTEPLRRGPLDFHLVVSNEAWYRESFEYDQMIAFSRLLAIETGRSFVRATNAGITLVLAPDGSEVGRLTVGDRDRMVAGTLRATVPVPKRGERASAPPYVRFERAWIALWIGLPVLLVIFCRRRERYPTQLGR